MKRIVAFALPLTAAFAAAAPAYAAYQISGSFSINGNNFVETGNAYTISNLALDLDVPVEVNLFDIWTDRVTPNLGDFLGRFITVRFDFTSTGGNKAKIEGASGAEIFGQNSNRLRGAVYWGPNDTIKFADGAKVRIHLEGAKFNQGAQNTGTLKAGVANGSSVIARFTLVQAPVPEPATWALMLVGFALAGGVIRRSQRGFAIA